MWFLAAVVVVASATGVVSVNGEDNDGGDENGPEIVVGVAIHHKKASLNSRGFSIPLFMPSYASARECVKSIGGANNGDSSGLGRNRRFGRNHLITDRQGEIIGQNGIIKGIFKSFQCYAGDLRGQGE